MNLRSRYVHFLLREFVSPVNIGIAIIVGAGIQLLQGATPWNSAIPYAAPIIVQAFSKSTLRYRRRYADLLLQLPAMREDPTFVVERDGSVLASAGRSQSIIREFGIKHVHDLLMKPACFELEDALSAGEPARVECYSDLLRRWYSIRLVPDRNSKVWLVWFHDVSDRVEFEERMRRVRDLSHEMINAVARGAGSSAVDERIVEMLGKEGYAAVFITRTHPENRFHGHVFRFDGRNIEVSASIAGDSANAPIHSSRKQHRVVAVNRREDETQDAFELDYPFLPEVREFVGTPIVNFVNFHAGPLSVIAFNHRGGVSSVDESIFESVVSAAHLADSAASRDG